MGKEEDDEEDDESVSVSENESDEEYDDEDEESEEDHDREESVFKAYLQSEQGKELLRAEIERLQGKTIVDDPPILQNSRSNKRGGVKGKSVRFSTSEDSQFSILGMMSTVGSAVLSLYPGLALHLLLSFILLNLEP